MRIGTQSSQRTGTTLILCALMLFVIFAVAALVIDMGFVRLTHREMQTATDSAAREGLRYRDTVPAWLQDLKNTNADLFAQMQAKNIDPATSAPDEVRRFMATNQVNETYQDLTDPVTGKVTQFGAGPEFQVSGGTGAGYAEQTIAIPGIDPATGGAVPIGVTAYKPRLQLNKGNAQEGDLRSGNFSAVPISPDVEQADYSRSDFSQPPTGTLPDAFLIRLRRTNDPRGNQRVPLDNEPDISTTGNALPLLFGQATLIHAADPNAYSYRRDGVSVRGTSIAQGRPALAVGKAVSADTATNDPGMAGAATFSISLTTWKGAATFTVKDVASFTPPRASGMVMAGDTLIALSAQPGALPPPAANQVYVPLIDATTGLVAGFGYVTSDGVTLTKVVPRIASENATASTSVFIKNPNDQSIPDLNNPTVSSVLTTLLSTTNTGANQMTFLLAPALVR
jgi:hypothetical protein